MGADETSALFEATFRILLLALALTASVWLTVRLVRARRDAFHSGEPRPEERRDECQEEYHLRSPNPPDDEPPSRRF